MKSRFLALLAPLSMCTGTAFAASKVDFASPLFRAPGPDDVLVQLVDASGDDRGFCLDYPGFPASGNVKDYPESTWPIGTHTCKVRIEHSNIALMDQLFSAAALKAGKLEFARLGICMQVLTFKGVNVPGHVQEISVREDAQIIAGACSGEPDQRFEMTADGKIKSILDPTRCLTIGREAFEAGDRAPGQPWHRRDVGLARCAASAADRQTWRVIAPPAP